jgi:hypothetical protein
LKLPAGGRETGFRFFMEKLGMLFAEVWFAGMPRGGVPVRGDGTKVVTRWFSVA